MLNALRTFAQETPVLYNTVSPSDDYVVSMASDEGGVALGVVVGLVVSLVLAVAMFAGLWKTFQKAGKPGWAAIVPIYNVVVLMEIIGRPVWWVALYFAGVVPIIGTVVSLVAAVIATHDLSKSFGKDAGFTVLLILLPFVAYPMLGFGNAQYVGPAAAPKNDGAGAVPAAPVV